MYLRKQCRIYYAIEISIIGAGMSEIQLIKHAYRFGEATGGNLHENTEIL
jgi:hypothetical protein